MNKRVKNVFNALIGVAILAGIFGAIFYFAFRSSKKPSENKSVPIPKKEDPRLYTKYNYHHGDSLYEYSIKIDTVIYDEQSAPSGDDRNDDDDNDGDE